MSLSKKQFDIQTDSVLILAPILVILLTGLFLRERWKVARLLNHIEILASDVEDLSDLVPHSDIARRACVDVDQALAEIPVRED